MIDEPWWYAHGLPSQPAEDWRDAEPDYGSAGYIARYVLDGPRARQERFWSVVADVTRLKEKA